MNFVIWLVEWMGQSLPLLQISMDTGWFHSQQERMPYIQREIHSRLVTWLSDDKEKK